jgi:hypothetical protein
MFLLLCFQEAISTVDLGTNSTVHKHWACGLFCWAQNHPPYGGIAQQCVELILRPWKSYTLLVLKSMATNLARCWLYASAMSHLHPI